MRVKLLSPCFKTFFFRLRKRHICKHFPCTIKHHQTTTKRILMIIIRFLIFGGPTLQSLIFHISMCIWRDETTQSIHTGLIVASQL